MINKKTKRTCGDVSLMMKMMILTVISSLLVISVSANSPPRFLLDTNVGSEIVLRLTEGDTRNASILR